MYFYFKVVFCQVIHLCTSKLRLFFVKLSIFVLAVVFLDKYQRYVFLFKQNGIIRFAFGNVFPHQINNIFCGNACYVSDQVDYVVD